MSIFSNILSKLYVIIEDMKASGEVAHDVSVERIDVSPAKDPAHGDAATNAAMVIAAQMHGKPIVFAESIVRRMRSLSGVEKAEIAGPGFINLTFSPSVWHEEMLHILREGHGYGASGAGRGVKVNVEYVSANPTGPMHVGHARGAVVGDALALLLIKAGYEVTREYYINDAGAQIEKLAESAYLRYREACGERIAAIPEGFYPGEYLVPVGKALKTTHGHELMDMGRAEWMPAVRECAVAAMMDMIRSDLAAIGIRHDVFTSELALTRAGKVQEAIDELARKGLIYQGVLDPPKGKAPDDWEPREQTLFRSSRFGDDCDRPVRKSDGSWTYFAPDIAYHYDKCKRGFGLLIDVFGADHGGYVKRLKAAVSALSDGKVEIEARICQLVKFLRDGEPAKMSKRAGTFVTVNEVVDEVGKDAFRFMMLTRKNDAPLDFDFAKVLEQSKDNPVFYVQYAHARARSIVRHAAADMPQALALAEASPEKVAARLIKPQELALIRHLCAWPRAVEQAAAALEPHRVAYFLQDVAAAFHGFWNLGNEEIGFRFLQKHDMELTAARLALVRAVALTIASGLMVLGVEPVEEMR